MINTANYMNAITINYLYTERFDELRRYFISIQAPYNLSHIREFNAIYRRIYPSLTREERRRAEDFVDTLIEGLERREWASKIFGVV